MDTQDCLVWKSEKMRSHLNIRRLKNRKACPQEIQTKAHCPTGMMGEPKLLKAT